MKYVYEIDLEKILRDMHNCVCGGHYKDKTTTHKVLRSSFWWPTISKYAHEFFKTCDSCQRFSGKLKLFEKFPLRPVEV